MISFIRRARKHVGYAAPDDRSDDAEHDCPEDRDVHVHHRFRDNPRDQTDKNIPDQVKHAFAPGVCLRNVVEYNPGFRQSGRLSHPLRGRFIFYGE